MAGIRSKKQPKPWFARGSDGRWYHWRTLAKLGIGVGAALFIPTAARAVSDYFDLDEIITGWLDSTWELFGW